MSKSGKPAFDSGMRGKEPANKPPAPAPGKAKTPIKRLSIEKGDTGYRIDVERHPEPPKKGKDGKPEYDPQEYDKRHEQHHHASKQSAIAHHSQLMEEMGSSSSGRAGAEIAQAAPGGR